MELYYGIGLDVGVGSVGWAAVELGESGEPCRILDLGSRVFTAAENPKDGSSLAVPRREARSMRRRLRRKRHRKERIRQLLCRQLLSEQELNTLYEGQLPDIYALRVRALDEALTRQELARVLLHLAQRRGFQSNRKDANDKEQGKLLQAVQANAQRMQGYRTVGEMLYKHPDFAGHKRNQSGDYLCTVARSAVVQEVETIFAAQRALGAVHATEQLQTDYLALLLSQRSFADGPGPGSPYSGSNDEHTVGLCTLEPAENGQKRAAKASYSFELFTLWQAINHIRIEHRGQTRALTQQERDTLFALAHKTEKTDYTRIRKQLELGEEELFRGINYLGTERDAAEKKKKFDYLRAWHAMRKALDKVGKDRIRALDRDALDEAGLVLTLNLPDDAAVQRLRDAGLTDYDIQALLTLSGSFRGRSHISVTACRKLLPHLEQGMTYDAACTAAGYDFRGHAEDERTATLHPTAEDYADITSPVVKRAVSQTCKVINALVRRYGSPVYVNVEQARELAHSKKERDEMSDAMENNQRKNEENMEYLRNELHIPNPSGQDLVKLKLWREQGEVCPYSQKHLDIARLFEPGYADVDHIIPYSISFDDGYKNKVLVRADENRQKGNRLPLQYLTGEKRDKFTVWVQTNIRDYRKRQKLLKEKITPEELAQFKQRSLQDTQWTNRFLYNFIKDNLQLRSMPGIKSHVYAVNGAVTGHLRKRWGIAKIRADGDAHHAKDAAVIACTTQGMIQSISEHAARRESRYLVSEDGAWRIDRQTGEAKERFPLPWPRFTDELTARLSDDPAAVLETMQLPCYTPADIAALRPVFVSRMPNHKVTGAAHKETVYSSQKLQDDTGAEYLVRKVALTALKLDKDGEIADYYMPQSDVLLYEALKAQLHRHGGNAAKAFEQPFHKPKADGTPGPLVKTVKVTEKSTSSVAVMQGNGNAKNDSMVRVDVFHVEGDGYYLVPIYVADTKADRLPNRAIVQGKPYTDWKVMQDKNFLFSLYAGDLIRVSAKKPIKMILANKDSSLPGELSVNPAMLYYVSSDISTASISTTNHDRSYSLRGLGVKTLLKIEKYQVDVLGHYTPVHREVRQLFR